MKEGARERVRTDGGEGGKARESSEKAFDATTRAVRQDSVPLRRLNKNQSEYRSLSLDANVADAVERYPFRHVRACMRACVRIHMVCAKYVCGCVYMRACMHTTNDEQNVALGRYTHHN